MRIGQRIGIFAACMILGPALESAANAQAAAAEVKKQLPPEVDKINSAARQMYSGARKKLLASMPAVLFVSSDDLVLIRYGKRTVVNVVPAEYHVRKSLSHSVLGLFALLAQGAGKPIDKDQLKALKDYQTLLTAARSVVEKFGFDADSLARQKRVLDRAEQLTAKALKDGKVSKEELTKFCRASRADVLANAKAAARVQLLGIHGQMMKWKKELSAEDWAQLTVIVPGPPTAREGNVAIQYFARLFGESKAEGKRIVYAESTYDEENALNVLGTLRLDARLSGVVFGDRYRLHRDFLADGARSVIDEILAPP